MLNREPESGTATEGVAEDVDLLVAELLQHDSQVVADIDEIDRSVAERRSAVPVQVDANHLPLLREHRDERARAEHVDRPEPAVQDEQRLSRTVDLVVVVD